MSNLVMYGDVVTIEEGPNNSLVVEWPGQFRAIIIDPLGSYIWRNG